MEIKQERESKTNDGPIYPDIDSWDLSRELSREENKMYSSAVLSWLINVIGTTRYVLTSNHPDQVPYHKRLAGLPVNEAEKLLEHTDKFIVFPRDMANIYILEEVIYWMNGRGVDIEKIESLKKILLDSKAKLFDAIALDITHEYGFYAAYKVEPPDKEHYGYRSPYFAFTEDAMRDYIQARINSDDPSFAFSPQGRALLLSGLEKITNTLKHEPWDTTLSLLKKMLADPEEIDGHLFQNLLMEVHDNGMILSGLAGCVQADQDLVLAILAMHNSGMYGIRNTWNYLPTSTKQILTSEKGAVFDMVDALGPTSDITRVINSILKPDSFRIRLQLAKAIYNFEPDPRQKMALKNALKSKGIQIP